MFVDGRSIEDGSVLTTDIAIIGAGAAGITIARELADSKIDVTLIESGGLDFEPDTQALYDGQSVGMSYPLDSSRLRYFGGSTNHWGGWCRPFDALDFEQRDWVENSGWPITRDDLDPFYRRAIEVCQIPSFNFDDPEGWSEGGRYEPLDLPGNDVLTRFFLYSPPTRFGQVYRNAISKASNIRTLLHSNVLEIVPDETAKTVKQLNLGTLSGKRFSVSPKICILATGGVENARLLLLSNSMEKAGLGNAHGVVGRYFMEHPHVDRPVEMLFTNPDAVADYYRTYTKINGTNLRAVFMFSADYQRRSRRVGTVMTFYESKEIRTDVESEEKDPDVNRSIEPGLLNLIRSTTSTPATSPRLGRRYGSGCATEQIPNPLSRITLSNERDVLGQNRASVEWRLSGEDRANLRRNMETLARTIGNWGKGRVRILFPDRDSWEEAEGWGNHHMGTTRMANDPRRGVVNADCRVHGIANLYVAGSSVFTTSSTVNPTLTIVALALRLADHVQSRFAEEGA
jgi:choline dehydrogenase-like flavoprotein